jgi:hypothetical protein
MTPILGSVDIRGVRCGGGMLNIVCGFGFFAGARI